MAVYQVEQLVSRHLVDRKHELLRGAVQQHVIIKLQGSRRFDDISQLLIAKSLQAHDHHV